MKILFLLTFTLLNTLSFGQVPSDSIRLYFPFNGNANDESGNGNNGTVSGAILTTDRFGNANSAYWFDGDNDYVEVPDNESLSITGALTISMWYRYDGKPQNWGRILSKAWNSVAPPYVCYGISLDDSPEGSQKVLFQAHLSASQTSYSNFSTTSMTVGEWYHLVGVYDPANNIISLYVNGIREAYSTTGNSTIANTTGHLRVADDQQTLEGAKGVLDDIRIYAKALSQIEILSLYFEVPQNLDGSLDLTFGNGGITSTTSGVGQGIKIQSDGKILVGGGVFAVARFNTDGSLDTSFGNDGIVSTQVGSGYSSAWGIALQSDGKIVLIGNYEISSNNSGIALVRYNSDGNLDNSFGSNGVVTLDITSGYDYANSIEIQSNDQKIVISGQTNGVMVARFNPNGSLDNTFGTNGIVSTQVGTSCGSNSMKIQNDGKIIVAGGMMDSQGYQHFLTIRYNSDGSLDNTFGTGGIVTTTVGTGFQWGWDLAIQNAKIVVGGIQQLSSAQEFVLIKYNSDGSIDNTFGASGVVHAMPLGISDYLRSISLQTDGKILAGGFSVIDSTGAPINNPQIGMSLMRFESSGNLDNSFGNSGVVVIPLGEFGFESGRGLAVQNDHKIVFAGFGETAIMIARFNVNSISSVKETENTIIPSTIVLEQNYPNPFNPSTKLNFSIPNYGNVKLEIFNLLGEKIVTLVDEYLSAGNYESDFNARNLSSGIYLYKLSSDGFVQTRKMLLIK
ncbi:MAG: T9SS type A sorting domain-containing protein [bacterium]|nr:T9SS type A sorting domain-containing protein [bacterium]